MSERNGRTAGKRARARRRQFPLFLYSLSFRSASLRCQEMPPTKALCMVTASGGGAVVAVAPMEEVEGARGGGAARGAFGGGGADDSALPSTGSTAGGSEGEGAGAGAGAGAAAAAGGWSSSGSLITKESVRECEGEGAVSLFAVHCLVAGGAPTPTPAPSPPAHTRHTAPLRPSSAPVNLCTPITTMSLASLLHLHTRPSDALIFTLLAAPHLLYAHAWLFSKAWRSAFGSNAVRVLEVLAAAGKGEGRGREQKATDANYQ